MMKKSFFFILTIALSIFISCKKDKTPEITPVSTGSCVDVVSFSQTIQPLIEQSCATTGCHDSQTHESGFTFTGYQNISLFMDPTIIGSIRHDPGFSPMPYSLPKLSDSLIQKIECWMSQGQLDN